MQLLTYSFHPEVLPDEARTPIHASHLARICLSTGVLALSSSGLLDDERSKRSKEMDSWLATGTECGRNIHSRLSLVQLAGVIQMA